MDTGIQGSNRVEPSPRRRDARPLPISASPRRRQGTGRLHRQARTARPGVFCEAEASDQLLAARPRQQDTARPRRIWLLLLSGVGGGGGARV